MDRYSSGKAGVGWSLVTNGSFFFRFLSGSGFWGPCWRGSVISAAKPSKRCCVLFIHRSVIGFC